MRWRVLALKSYDAYMNMAIDEAISNAVKNGGMPTLRFYKWEPAAVSIGYFQSLLDEIDVDACKEQGIDIVRRRTGGGAVYHGPGELTYSVIAPAHMFPKNIIDSYREICGWIVDALDKLGISAEFVPINDIVVDGKKISGNAQSRREGVLLQHGTILHEVDVDTMFSLLKVPDDKIRDKLIATVKERVTSIIDHRKVLQQRAYAALLEGFLEGKRYEFSEIGPEELEEAKSLAEERYRSREWNYQR